MEKVRKIIRGILIEDFNINNNENVSLVLANTSRYKIVKFRNSYRIVNYTRFYRNIPFIEITKEQAEKFLSEINFWKKLPTVKKEDIKKAISMFNLTANEMFHNKNTQLYLDDDLDDDF